MKFTSEKMLLAALIFGVGFSWYTVINDFIRFNSIYGTVFKVENCSVPNPITTPCFYGAIAFFIALLLLLFKKYSYLKYLLIGGTAFAWANFTYEAYKFYQPFNTSKIGCSGIEVINIFNTPCFYGALIYLLALFIFLNLKKK